MAEEQEEQQVQEKKSNSIVLIFIIGIIVFLLIIGAVLFFVLSGEDEQVDPNSANSDAKASVEQPAESLGKVRRSNSIEVGFMFELDTFIVNLLSENGRRYLKIKVNLELESEDLAEEVTAKIPVIRDIVIRIASSKTLEEIATEKGKDTFKDQVLMEVNAIMKDGRVQNVYFTDFVIQ
jgi:flagellar FliL protein